MGLKERKLFGSQKKCVLKNELLFKNQHTFF